jgi:hypothetical protein
MKLRRSFSHPSFCLLALSICATSVTEAATNKKPVAKAGSDQTVGFSFPVALNGSLSIDPDGTIKRYRWSQINGPKVFLANPLSAKPSFTSPPKLNNQKPLALIFRLTVTDNQKAVASDNVVINVVTGKLNDTGIANCSNGGANGLRCPVADYLGQDAESGRDDTNYYNEDGIAGFSFTKISNAGKTLPAKVVNWDCVKDNITGLMWEVKTNDGGLHHYDWIYTWYEPDNTKNGGTAGTQNGGICSDKKHPAASACDTDAYVKAVNAAGWCGAKDWRLPTKEELHSIVSYADDYYERAVDTAYFPSAAGRPLWSASPYAGNPGHAWYVGFDFGYGYWASKDSKNDVMLVRGGQ